MRKQLNNLNIVETLPLLSPGEFKNRLPIEEELKDRIVQCRDDVTSILEKKDNRILAIVGPCSIHDPEAAMDYAGRLAVLRKKYLDRLYIIMRVYFEKPRTSMGWRGLILDPDLNGTYDIEKGLSKARSLLIEINKLGLPAGTEILDPIIPQYISELLSWAAIGARTSESQTHREIASGLSMPIGFKNGTDGSLMKALNAIDSARHSHCFIGIDQEGMTSVFRTRGNPTGHLILRGGAHGPNYYEENIEEAEELMKRCSINPSIIVDCSHANSGKKCSRQERVLNSVMDQIKRSQDSIRGFMLESNLVTGNQNITEDLSKLVYGKSITDECIGWEETEELLAFAYESLGS